MDIMTLSSQPQSLWKMYRSKRRTTPYNRLQAYNLVYPWVEFGGVWISREYEYLIHAAMAGVVDNPYFKAQWELLKEATESALAGLINFNVVIPKPSLTNTDIAIKELSNQSEVGVIGHNRQIKSSIHGTGISKIVTSEISLGGDEIASEANILHRSIPVIITESRCAELAQHVINWNNIWVIGD